MRTFLHPALAVLLIASGIPATASGSGGGADALHLVEMDEIRVPIIDGDRAAGTLRFKLVLETRSEAAAHDVTATLPLLRAASLSAGIEFARLYASPMLPVDARRLATDLTAALQAQDPGIARVLLVEVQAANA